MLQWHRVNREPSLPSNGMEMSVWINVEILIKTSSCHSSIEFFKIKLIMLGTVSMWKRLEQSSTRGKKKRRIFRFAMVALSSAIDVLGASGVPHKFRNDIIRYNRNVSNWIQSLVVKSLGWFSDDGVCWFCRRSTDTSAIHSRIEYDLNDIFDCVLSKWPTENWIALKYTPDSGVGVVEWRRNGASQLKFVVLTVDGDTPCHTISIQINV